MANRRFQRAQNLEREVKSIYCEFQLVGGVPEIIKALGVESVAKTATGDFKITLQDKYNRFMHMSGMLMSATADNLTFQVKAEDVSNSKEVDVYTLEDGTPVDPVDGDSVVLKFDLKNTSVEN